MTNMIVSKLECAREIGEGDAKFANSWKQVHMTEALKVMLTVLR